VKLGLHRSLKIFMDLVGYRTHDLPACSIVPQPLLYSVPPTLWPSTQQKYDRRPCHLEVLLFLQNLQNGPLVGLVTSVTAMYVYT
jgi:hypothetical protein